MAQATTHPNHQLISSEDVEGTEVYDASGNNIGAIDHLMIEKVSGRVAYAVMSFGGFASLGQSHYPVPWGALKYDTSLGGFREQQLRDAPAFSDDAWGDRDWEMRTHKTTPRRITGSLARERSAAGSARNNPGTAALLHGSPCGSCAFYSWEGGSACGRCNRRVSLGGTAVTLSRQFPTAKVVEKGLKRAQPVGARIQVVRR